jgi:hypothetical protein
MIFESKWSIETIGWNFNGSYFDNISNFSGIKYIELNSINWFGIGWEWCLFSDSSLLLLWN